MDKKAGFKALAKRPKLVKFISKGTEFHKLKEIGEVSGGFIRNLMKVGIVSKDDGIVTFVKGMEKQIGSVEDTPKREKNVKEKPSKKAKGKAKDEDEDEEDEDEDEKPAKKGKRSREDESEEDEESDEPKSKKKREKPAKQPKKSAVEKTAVVKLKKPIKDIPANHKEDAEYYDGFWWVQGHRIATQNLMFLKGPE